MSEQISALMDDEIAVEDAEHLLTSINVSKSAAQAWNHYHLIGDVMRNDVGLSLDFKQKLMHKLDQEPTVLAPSASKASLSKADAHKKLPASWSIAASFAAVMVVGWMALQQQTHSDPVNSIALAKTEVNVASPAKVAVADETIPDEYLMAHQSFSPSASSYYIQSVNYSE